jgi:hypothetical protein
MKSASAALRSLITMEANQRSLRKLLGLTIQPALPAHLMSLLQDLDTADASGLGRNRRRNRRSKRRH